MTSPVIGVWLIARIPTWATYTCRCWLGRRCITGLPTNGKTCPCWGRTDTDLPAHCCSRSFHRLTDPTTLETLC